MGERTQYTPGTFCWTDLSTTDQDAAKAFYAALFGWEAEDLPVGDGAVYSMMRVDGKDVAAISAQQPQQREAGIPPTWNSYVSVESADAAAQRAGELGATVHAPPFDVLDSGRMSVIQDPQGAIFLVWEPRQHFGAALVNQPGALVWNELSTPDIDGATSFYGGLFGWTVEEAPNTPEPYFGIKNGDANNGGIREHNQPNTPPHWLVYLGCEDIDSTLAKLDELGGSKMMGPMDIQIAKIAIVLDPQGAAFGLYAGQYQP
jgi:predicted enzyme related to lactoylglutathione lyase